MRTMSSMGIIGIKNQTYTAFPLLDCSVHSLLRSSIFLSQNAFTRSRGGLPIGDGISLKSSVHPVADIPLHD
ncbi:hypothetical protein JHK82_028017 [Glycine max]|nr:hypothetical protein JHK82_028017 [Glycine max]